MSKLKKKKKKSGFVKAGGKWRERTEWQTVSPEMKRGVVKDRGKGGED